MQRKAAVMKRYPSIQCRRPRFESLEVRLLLASAVDLPSVPLEGANSVAASAAPQAAQSFSTILASDLAFASTQLKQTMNDLGNVPSNYVDRTDSTGKWKVVTSDDWTSGYLPGAFWQM